MENKNQPKKKTQLSIIIRDPVEKLNRSGINCLKYEINSSNILSSSSSSSISSKSNQQHLDRLFTAGRDSTIRVYTNLIPTTQSSHNSNNPASFDLNNIDKYYQMSLSNHTDWVNDIVVCKTTKTIFSASSDTTVKIWNSTKGTLLNTLRLHKDYVKCLSHAKDKQLLASAGFDKNIFLWDISTGTVLNPSGYDVKSISDNKYSIYSLALNNQGTVLASGSPENCIRLWDPRTSSKIMKLKGHTHNIRYLVLNRDGTQCLSASSDHTIRLWSLGQQRCISTIEIHTEGVWTLCVNDSFNKVYSGGKDNRVYATDLRNPDDSVLICEETDPVLSIDFGHEQESLWISTTSSSIKNWSLKQNNDNQAWSMAKSNSSQTSSHNSNISSSNNNNNSQMQLTNSTDKQTKHLLSNNSNNLSLNTGNNQISDFVNKSNTSSLSSSFLLQNPLNTQPLITIRGTSSIKQYHILNDKRYIVTKDTDDNVCVWDVLQARKLESLGKENYENAIKVRQRFISVPNWFTVDLKLGILTINLDESEWQSAWINFKDMDSNHVRQTQNIDLSEAKVNYGFIFLESLFKNCLFLNPTQLQTCSNVVMSQTSNQNQTNQTQTINNNNNNNSTQSSNINLNKENENGQAGLLRFNIPEHTPIIFSEVAGRTLHRIEVRDMSKDSEQQTLSNVIPTWIIDALLGKTVPKFNRINFVLNPYNQNQKIVNKDRLSSIDLLQVKKLKEHVYTKILKLDQQSGNETNTQSFNDTNNNSNYKSNETSFTNSNNLAMNNQQTSNNSINNTNESNGAIDIPMIANRTIELICSEQILSDPEMNLRTIKHLIWKGSGDLTILYRLK